MWSVTFSLVRLQTPRWWFVSSSVSSEGRMWKKPSWRQRRGFTRTSKMAVWTWMLQSRESSTNRLHLREAASTPTASRPKKAAAANQRQKLQTHRTDGHRSSSPGSTRSADPSHQTGFRWIIFHISVLTRPKHRLTAPHRSSVLQSNIHQLWINQDSNSSRISQLSGPLCLDQDHPRPKLDHCPD